MSEEACCEYSTVGNAEIDRFITLAFCRNQTDIYRAKPFRYCPWCGKETRKNKVDTKHDNK